MTWSFVVGTVLAGSAGPAGAAIWAAPSSASWLWRPSVQRWSDLVAGFWLNSSPSLDKPIF